MIDKGPSLIFAYFLLLVMLAVGISLGVLICVLIGRLLERFLSSFKGFIKVFLILCIYFFVGFTIILIIYPGFMALRFTVFSPTPVGPLMGIFIKILLILIWPGTVLFGSRFSD